MRRLVCLLALAASSVFMLGAAPAASAAPTCSLGKNASSLAGRDLRYAATVYNCTDVQAVNWVYHPAGNPIVGWYDWTLGGWASGGIGTLTSWGNWDYAIAGSCTGICVAYVHQTAWWTGACRVIQGRWYVSLLGVSTGLWTTPVTVVNAQQTICA